MSKKGTGVTHSDGKTVYCTRLEVEQEPDPNQIDARNGRITRQGTEVPRRLKVRTLIV